MAFLAISRIDAPISSAPVATVCTFRDTCSAAADTTLACAAVSSAFAPHELGHCGQVLRSLAERHRVLRDPADTTAEVGEEGAESIAELADGVAARDLDGRVSRRATRRSRRRGGVDLAAKLVGLAPLALG